MRETRDARSLAGPASFELERFDWTGPDRLEIAGRWFGVRGLRFMRPTLELRGDRNRRLLALLEHKPWAAEDGDEWVAAFAWDGEREEFSAAELAVAPSVVVELSPPGSADGGSGEIATAVDQRASRATPPAANGAKRSSGARKPAKRPVADAGDADTARELRELRAERDAAVRERDAAVAERAAAVAERAAAVSERATAVAERDAAVAERDAAIAERDAAAVARVAAMAERDQIAAARKTAPKERDAAGPAALDAAVRERDAAARERDQAVAERDAALAAAAEARRPPPPPPPPPPQPDAHAAPATAAPATAAPTTAPPATAPPTAAPPATAPPSPRRRRTVKPTVTGTDWTMRLFVLSAIALLLFILVAVIRGFL